MRGVLKGLWCAIVLLPGFAFGQAMGPYGVFGGPIPSGSLPPASLVPANTLAFTTDQGMMIQSGGTWSTFSSYPPSGIAYSATNQLETVGGTTTITCTGSLAANASSCTLSANWTGNTGKYLVGFSDGEQSFVTLTHNATTAPFYFQINGPATATLTVYVGGFQLSSGAEWLNGPSGQSILTSSGFSAGGNANFAYFNLFAPKGDTTGNYINVEPSDSSSNKPYFRIRRDGLVSVANTTIIDNDSWLGGPSWVETSFLDSASNALSPMLGIGNDNAGSGYGAALIVDGIAAFRAPSSYPALLQLYGGVALVAGSGGGALQGTKRFAVEDNGTVEINTLLGGNCGSSCQPSGVGNGDIIIGNAHPIRWVNSGGTSGAAEFVGADGGDNIEYGAGTTTSQHIFSWGNAFGTTTGSFYLQQANSSPYLTFTANAASAPSAPSAGQNIWVSALGLNLQPSSGNSAILPNGTPTVSACGTSPSVGTGSWPGSAAITVGTGGTVSACTIGLPTAAHGWNCSVSDITTQSTSVFLQKQTASSTTSATITNYNTAGTATAFTASDVLRLSCWPN